MVAALPPAARRVAGFIGRCAAVRSQREFGRRRPRDANAARDGLEGHGERQ